MNYTVYQIGENKQGSSSFLHIVASFIDGYEANTYADYMMETNPGIFYVVGRMNDNISIELLPTYKGNKKFRMVLA